MRAPARLRRLGRDLARRTGGIGSSLVLGAFVLAWAHGRCAPAPPIEAMAPSPQPPSLEPLGALAGPHTLSGTVTQDGGNPAVETLVVVFRPNLPPGEVSPIHHGTTDRSGQFSIPGIEAGEFQVALAHPGIPNFTRPVSIPSPQKLLLELPAPLGLPAALSGIQRTPLRGKLVLHRDSASFEVQFVPVEEKGAGPSLTGVVPRWASADPAGAFAIQDLAHGAYSVLVLPSDAGGGSWPVLGSTILMHPAPGDETLQIPLRYGGLGGGLVDSAGQAIEGALVTAWPPGHPDRLKATSTDGEGRFQLDLLPPGPTILKVRAGSAALELNVSVEDGTRREVSIEPLSP